MSADLDALLTHVYVLVDDLLPRRRRRGRPVRISDSELICLAIAQVLLDCPNERRFLRLATRRLGHLFPYIPGQSGFNKRLRALAPELVQAIALLARLSPSFCDRLRLLDSTPSEQVRANAAAAGWRLSEDDLAALPGSQHRSGFVTICAWRRARIGASESWRPSSLPTSSARPSWAARRIRSGRARC